MGGTVSHGRLLGEIVTGGVSVDFLFFSTDQQRPTPYRSRRVAVSAINPEPRNEPSDRDPP